MVSHALVLPQSQQDKNTATSMAIRKVTLALTVTFSKPMHSSSTLRSISLPRIIITPLVEIQMSAVDGLVKVFVQTRSRV